MNNQQLTKNLKCIQMRNGAEVWLEEERVQNLIDNLMLLSGNKFIKVNDEIINTADIVGVFSAQTMEEITRRKNGQWKCDYGYYHSKYEECAHNDLSKYNSTKNN